MEIALKSLSAAVVTAIILVLAKFVGPKLAGAIGGIPIVFAVSYVLVTMDDKAVSSDFLVGGIYGAIAAIFFCLALIGLNSVFLKMHWVNFIIAYIACFFVALALVHFSSNS